jgi:hypothetical protein
MFTSFYNKDVFLTGKTPKYARKPVYPLEKITSAFD